MKLAGYACLLHDSKRAAGRASDPEPWSVTVSYRVLTTVNPMVWLDGDYPSELPRRHLLSTWPTLHLR